MPCRGLLALANRRTWTRLRSAIKFVFVPRALAPACASLEARLGLRVIQAYGLTSVTRTHNILWIRRIKSKSRLLLADTDHRS